MARLLGMAVFFWQLNALMHAISAKTTSLPFMLDKLGTGSTNRGDGLRQKGTETTFAEQTCMTADEATAAVNRFSQLLQFRTVSSPIVPDHVIEPSEFQRLHHWMPGAYPEVWDMMTVEEVGSSNFSFLLKWEGTEDAADISARSSSHYPPSIPLLPVLFLSHLDVVPVANETLSNWTYGPFSGAVEEGYVWGRGALD
ncbi:hypothetical protein Vafri_14522, partial [Volvox africanus]